MPLNRKPTIQEKKLIGCLIEKSAIVIHPNWKNKLMVCPMRDGGMGSLRLFPNGNAIKETKFGTQVSELIFSDSDGIEVIASLNLDDEGQLFELDIWKTNYAKLIKIPDL
jgi:hypothetical protein